ncbi:uncharacterized protein [Oncorhynchus clarkii lewisi]|uniref:uncharacterized protein n=1 Tax=Oncorhynchus clarkii lewisi TaxID=490388 RepID=UPI0039B9950F
MKTFPTSAVWCFGILFISVSLITTGSSEVQVVGPADRVVALAGDDIILPCFLKPNVSAKNMTVNWTRLNAKAENVHLYDESRDSYVDQFPSYKGRTSMFHEELKNGNVSLKLNRVNLSDAGNYSCLIPTLTSQVKNTTVQLLVGTISQPVISIVGTKDWGVVLKCESGGWFLEPEMEWLDSSGTILPADGPPERHKDSEGRYAVRRHVTVNQTDTNRFTCRVHLQEINHLKETEIHVPDDVFPQSQVGLIIGLIAAAVVVLTASAGVYMWRKHTECRKLLEEQGAIFVDDHKDQVIQRVTKVMPIMYELFYDLYCNTRINQMTRQDQMRQLYKALEEAEDTRKVKSDFYRILLDLEPDIVKDLGPDSNETEFLDLCRLNKNLCVLLDKVTREREKVRKQRDDALREVRIERDGLKEELRKAKETIQSLSTSPGGQRETQNPSQKSERIEGMESLPGRKSVPEKEMESLPGSGRKSVPEMEMESLPGSGRKSVPEKEMETLPGSGRKSVPEREMESLPGSGRKSVPEKEMESLPGSGRKSVPEKEMESLPGSGRKCAPGSGRKSAPEMESLPGSGRKSVPEKEMESLPGSGRKSAPGSGRKSAPGSGRKSAPEMESLPSSGRKSVPEKEMESLPGSGRKSVPEKEMESLPGSGRKSAPGSGRKSAPGSGRKSAPEMEMESLPGSGRKSAPGSGRKSVPEKEMESLPGSGRKSVPEMEMESLPGSGRKSAPEMEMESLPGSGRKSAPGSGRNSAPGSGRKSAPGSGRKSAPEMESLPGSGRKSVPEREMESLPGSGRKSAPEMESLPGSGRKSVPEMEMESLPGSGSLPEKKPLLGPRPQNDNLDELERGGRVTIDNNYML